MSRHLVLSLSLAFCGALPLFAGIETWSSGVVYTYDGSGNVKTIGSNVYVYDTAGRLISGTVGGASNKQQFEYDAFGNRTNATRTGALCMGNVGCEESVPVDLQTNRLGPRTDIAYNQEGDLIAIDGSYGYSYDALGSMTSQSDTHGTREYVYTADGERIGVYNGGWNWTVRDLSGQVLREYTSTGTLGNSNWKWRRDHIYRGALLLASVNQTYDTNDLPVSGSYKTFRFHLDHLGTPRIVTDASGSLVGEHGYYPYGGELSVGSTESPRDPLRYTGHERDDIGDIHSLDYMHARYYSASLGRFLSADPHVDVERNSRDPQSWNRYAYSGSNPLTFFDPNGRDKKIHIVQSFAWDVAIYRWSSTEALASDGYEVNPHRIGGELTNEAVLSRSDETDFAILFGHGSASGMADQKFFSMNSSKQFNSTNVMDGFWLAGKALERNGPGGIVLAGCNTLKVAQELAKNTGIAVIGTNGLMGMGQQKRAIDALVVYISKHHKLDAGAVEAMNKAAGPAPKCEGGKPCNGQYVLVAPTP